MNMYLSTTLSGWLICFMDRTFTFIVVTSLSNLAKCLNQEVFVMVHSEKNPITWIQDSVLESVL